MKVARVTSSGQVSIPAAIRRRWGTSRVLLDDRGDSLVVKPLPEDPVAAVRGILQGRLPAAEELRKAARHDEAAALARREAAPRRRR